VTEIVKQVERRALGYQRKDAAVRTSSQGAEGLQQQYRGHALPLVYEVPMALRDNIKVEGVATLSP